jgi:hypothetical protein
MIVRLASTSPWVLLGSGDFFSVQLMNSARSPVKSYVVSVMTELWSPGPPGGNGRVRPRG